MSGQARTYGVQKVAAYALVCVNTFHARLSLRLKPWHPAAH